MGEEGGGGGGGGRGNMVCIWKRESQTILMSSMESGNCDELL